MSHLKVAQSVGEYNWERNQDGHISVGLPLKVWWFARLSRSLVLREIGCKWPVTNRRPHPSNLTLSWRRRCDHSSWRWSATRAGLSVASRRRTRPLGTSAPQGSAAWNLLGQQTFQHLCTLLHHLCPRQAWFLAVFPGMFSNCLTPWRWQDVHSSSQIFQGSEGMSHNVPFSPKRRSFWFKFPYSTNTNLHKSTSLLYRTRKIRSFPVNTRIISWNCGSVGPRPRVSKNNACLCLPSSHNNVWYCNSAASIVTDNNLQNQDQNPWPATDHFGGFAGVHSFQFWCQLFFPIL